MTAAQLAQQRKRSLQIAAASDESRQPDGAARILRHVVVEQLFGRLIHLELFHQFGHFLEQKELVRRQRHRHQTRKDRDRLFGLALLYQQAGAQHIDVLPDRLGHRRCLLREQLFQAIDPRRRVGIFIVAHEHLSQNQQRLHVVVLATGRGEHQLAR